MVKLFFAFVLCFLSFYLRLRFIPKLNLKDGQLVKVTGYLSDEPQILGSQQKFRIGQFEITSERYPELHYGEKIEASGKIEIKGNKYKIKYLLNYPKIEPVSVSQPGTGIKKVAIVLRIKIRDIFNQIFSRPYDGIASGVTLGDKSLIDKDFWGKLKATGTLHIMVASGSNIALFTEGLLAILCAIFVRKISLFILISLIWFYALVAGFQPPIVRAAIMASLFYVSQIFSRQFETKRILWITGIIMILIDPFLITDVGFQLSFSATAGLVYLQPLIKKTSVKNIILNNNNFTSSLAAYLATTPILLLNFGQINLLSPLINLAVLWTIPFILQVGMGLGIIGLIGGAGIARIFSFLLFPLLFYLRKIIDLSAKLTFSQIEGIKMGWWWAGVYYFILAMWIKRKS